jgi:hypothetical protein
MTIFNKYADISPDILKLDCPKPGPIAPSTYLVPFVVLEHQQIGFHDVAISEISTAKFDLHYNSQSGEFFYRFEGLIN